jgi:diaminohydroxyphosphoribosylaminopyrimidine deaminase / 5-amino-6-(5-phosphoribosylamino)uracil reductase
VTDDDFMRRALALAERGRYSTSPNPMVGCVIVREGRVIGEGFHRRAGEAHAEVEALRTVTESPAGATAYVNLEPCCHHGHTPPCVDALIEARVARVVASSEDPNPLVAGQGFQTLRDAGISVEIGLLSAEAHRLNEKFLYAIAAGKPFVLLKTAMTFDGKLATASGDSQWITSDGARQKSLELREEYDAILVGSGTIVADNPRLTRRLGLNQSAQPWLRIIVDGRGEVPVDATVVSDGQPTLLITTSPERYRGRQNVEAVVAEAIDGELDLNAVLRLASERGACSLIAEGGALLHSSLIRANAWQKLTAFIAPMLVGGPSAPSILSGEGVERLSDAFRFRFDHVEQIGPDLMVVAYPLA